MKKRRIEYIEPKREIKISKRYYWRDLVGGVLHEPKEIGPYYDCDNINSWDGHESEEEAMLHLKNIAEKHGTNVGTSGRLVLICEVKIFHE